MSTTSNPKSASGATSTLSPQAREAVATAGELLIRAAAVLGALSPQDLQTISEESEGKLPDCLGWSLTGAAALSTQVRDSLATHPPKGWDVRLGASVHVAYNGTEQAAQQASA